MKWREIIIFARTLENSRVLIYLIFNEIQTSFSPCLKLFVLAHKALMIGNYEVLQKNCCNPFKTQKTIIKRNLRVISVKFAKDQ